MYVNFFVSSRRRHTRSLCDWSSDVCSSDLGWQLAEQIGDARPWRTQRVLSHVLWDQDAARDLCRDYVIEHLGAADGRSEERRVGKECRCRWGPGHYRTK